MKIRSQHDLDVLRRVRHEVTEQVHDDAYYTTKLAAVWQRAAQTAAYGSLGDFSATAFHALPLTRKQELKAAPLRYARVRLGRALKYYQTTGTTGVPTPTPRTAQDMITNTVSVSEAWRQLLTATEHRAAILLPSDIVPVADLMVGVCETLDVLHVKAYPFTMGISDWDRIIELWDVVDPTVVFIAPGVLMQFTQILIKRGLMERMRSSVRLLMLLGEVSTPELRGMVGQWWQARALDASYGSTESGTLATCCAADRLHLLTGANYFEIQQGSEIVPAEPGRTGGLVVTPLNHDARPLLRMETGDEVSITDGCDCGATTPVVTVHGRGSDATVVKGARIMTRDLEGIVYATGEVMGYLIETNEEGTQAALLLERMPNGVRDVEASVAGGIQDRTAERFGFRWESVRFVNRLPAVTKSGGSQKSWKRSNFRVVAEVGAP